MNILLVNKYWRKVGGVEEYCFLLEQVLRERGHEVVPFAQAEPGIRSTPYAKYFVQPVDPTAKDLSGRVRAATRAVAGRATVRALERLLDNVPIDIAHVVHAYHQLGTGLFPLLERRGIPVVLSVHDYKLCCPSYRLLDDKKREICTKCLDSPWKSPVAPIYTACWRGSAVAGVVLGAEAAVNKIRRPYSVAGRVLVSNELMRRCAVAGGVPPDRIRIVPNFWPAPTQPLVRTRAVHMLYVGRLVIEKGVDVLIRAAALTGIPIRIVGDGPSALELQSLAAEISAPVTFVGPIWGDGVEREMLAAQALVIPSRWHEVSPFVAYQAMTLELPIISSDVGGMPDLLRDQRGYLVVPDDVGALASAMRHVEARPEESEERARTAASFSRANLNRDRFVGSIAEAYLDLGVRI